MREVNEQMIILEWSDKQQVLHNNYGDQVENTNLYQTVGTYTHEDATAIGNEVCKVRDEVGWIPLERVKKIADQCMIDLKAARNEPVELFNTFIEDGTHLKISREFGFIVRIDVINSDGNKVTGLDLDVGQAALLMKELQVAISVTSL